MAEKDDAQRDLKTAREKDADAKEEIARAEKRVADEAQKEAKTAREA